MFFFFKFISSIIVIINPIDEVVAIESIDFECMRSALKQGDGLYWGDGHDKHSYSCSTPSMLITKKISS